MTADETLETLPAPAADPGVLLPGDVLTVAGPAGVPVRATLVPVTADRVARLSWPRRFGLVLLPILVVGVMWGGPASLFGDIRHALAPQAEDPPRPRADGAALFAQHCAQCHGPRGDGKGVASLTTPARYFGAEPFKFTDTTGTRIPTDANLVALLKRGIPGSSMPSFANLEDEQLNALVGHVRGLTRRGKYEGMLAKALKEEDEGGDPVDPAALMVKADAACVVGTSLPVPASFPPPTPESLSAARALFATQCANCHGPGGLGDGPQVGQAQFKNENGTPAVPRNLTTGVFKGGESHAHLYTRLRLGIPGTPMPAFDSLTVDQTAGLIDFVLSLSDEARKKAEEARKAQVAAGEALSN